VRKMRSRQLSRSVHLKVTTHGKIGIAPEPSFFVTDEERKGKNWNSGEVVNL